MTTTTVQAMAASDRELILTRLIDATPDKVYRAWTDPTLLKQWFAPLRYTTPVTELDVRAGGASLIVMRAPDGTELPTGGSISRLSRTGSSWSRMPTPKRGSPCKSRS